MGVMSTFLHLLGSVSQHMEQLHVAQSIQTLIGLECFYSAMQRLFLESYFKNLKSRSLVKYVVFLMKTTSYPPVRANLHIRMLDYSIC